MTGPFITLNRQGGDTIVVNAANINTILTDAGGNTAVSMNGEHGPIWVTESADDIVRAITEAQVSEAHAMAIRTQDPFSR